MSDRGFGIVRVRQAITVRLKAGDNESGVALLSALLFMILVAGLSVVLLSVILSQAVPSLIAQKSTRTIYAAQAGLQAALGIVRTAAAAPDTTGKVFGNPAALPCSITGKVDAEDDSTAYTVSMLYFATDPTGTTAAWQTANKLSCPMTATTTPRYAMLTSDGVAAAIPGKADATYGNRHLSAIYKFKVATINVAGGRIYDFNKGYCLRAASKTAGATMSFVASASCTNDALEMWVYDTDWKIKLASTTVTGATALCITGPAADGEGLQDALLQPCKEDSDASRWNQLWSWMGSHTWQGQKAVIADGPSNYYLTTGAAAGADITGLTLKVSTGTNGGFAPSAPVGAGAAGYLTNQIVNFKEFGRCADVTGEQIASTYMISYPCKQDPTGTGTYLNWNHKWFYKEPDAPATSKADQQIYINLNNDETKKYCLQSPSSGSYVTFVACTTDTNQKWTRDYNTGTYATSYLFRDSTGRCLNANAADLHDSNWSKVTVATCDGSLAQKWNAPATYTDSTVGGYKEIGG